MTEKHDPQQPTQGKEGGRMRIPLLPLRDILVFPATVVPLFVGRDKSIQALEQAMATNKEILLAAQIKAKTNDPTGEDIYKAGPAWHTLQLRRLPDGTVKVLGEGQRRPKILEFVQTQEFFMVEAEPLPEQASAGVE